MRKDKKRKRRPKLKWSDNVLKALKIITIHQLIYKKTQTCLKIQFGNRLSYIYLENAINLD